MPWNETSGNNFAALAGSLGSNASSLTQGIQQGASGLAGAILDQGQRNFDNNLKLWEYGINSPMVKNMIYLMTGNPIKGMNPKITWDMMTDDDYVGKFFTKYPFEVKPAVERMKEARKYYEASRSM